MPLNARNSKVMHRTVYAEYTVFVTLRRRTPNADVATWQQWRWRAMAVDLSEEVDAGGAANLTVFAKTWMLFREGQPAPPQIGDQIVEADGTISELNSAVPVQHKLFFDYVYRVDSVVVGVNE